MCLGPGVIMHVIEIASTDVVSATEYEPSSAVHNASSMVAAPVLGPVAELVTRSPRTRRGTRHTSKPARRVRRNREGERRRSVPCTVAIPPNVHTNRRCRNAHSAQRRRRESGSSAARARRRNQETSSPTRLRPTLCDPRYAALGPSGSSPA